MALCRVCTALDCAHRQYCKIKMLCLEMHLTGFRFLVQETCEEEKCGFQLFFSRLFPAVNDVFQGVGADG